MTYIPQFVVTPIGINGELEKIAEAIGDCLQREPTTPNQMNTALDMNSNKILNLPEAVDPTDPVRLQDMQEYVDQYSFGDVDLSSKQDTLVSGVNIKTVNGADLLGPGDLTVPAPVEVQEDITQLQLDVDSLESALAAAGVDITALEAYIAAISPTGTSLITAADNSAMRTVLGLLSGATTAKQDNTGDTTVGRLMIRGAFGLGASIVSTATDANDIITPGLWSSDSAPLANAPVGFSGRALYFFIGSTGYGVQVCFDPNDTLNNQMAFRQVRSSVWQPWSEVIHVTSPLYRELTPSVSNIAALKLRAGVFDNQKVFVAEYNTGTDVGGGSFIWNSTSTATPNDVTIFQVTAVATGRWIREYDVLTVEMAGAVLNNSTDSTATVQRAVTEAFALGSELYWADGTAVVTSNITNFHNVVHRGKGAVRRGSDTFYITPTSAQTNTIYVATTGSDTNDGLTAAVPLLTGQKAVDNIVSRQFFVVPGIWVILLAAGTYPRIRFPDNGLPSENIITLQGPSVGGTPNVPTAIIKEGATQSAFGILATKARILVKDIKIEDYNGSTSSSGIRVNNGDLFTDNAHLEDCFYGVSGVDWSLINVKGGVFNDCGFLTSNPASGTGHAIRGLFHAKFEVGTQSAGTLTGAPIIQNCAGAIRAQEGSTGHVDFTDIKDCASGIRLLVNSRLNVDGSSFKRITGSALYGTQGCHVDTTVDTVFGTGADANGRNYTGGFGSTASSMGIVEFSAANCAVWGVASTSHPNTVVNTTTNTVVSTLNIKRDVLNDTQYTGIAAKSIRLNVKGTLTGTTGTFKRLFIRFGTSTLLCSFAQVAVGAFQCVFQIDFIGTDSQFASVIGPNLSNTLSPMGSAFMTESTSTDKVLTLEAVLNNAADSITIQSVEIEQRGF